MITYSAPGLAQHRARDLAGEGALRSQWQSCAADADVAVARGLGRRVQRGERRRDRRSRRRVTVRTSARSSFT